MDNTSFEDTAEGYSVAEPLTPASAAQSLDASFARPPRVFLGVKLWNYSNAVRQMISQASMPEDSMSLFTFLAFCVVYDLGVYYHEASKDEEVSHSKARRIAFERLMLEMSSRNKYRTRAVLWQDDLTKAQIEEAQTIMAQIFDEVEKTDIKALDENAESGNR